MNEPTPAPSSDRFDLTSGALCLDFVNTWGDRNRAESDQLDGYDGLVGLVEQAGRVDPPVAAALREKALRPGRAAASIFREAVALRTSLYHMFSARADQVDIQTADLDRLNDALAGALARRRLTYGDSGFDWAWTATELALPVWLVARSAAELLTSEDLIRTRECASGTCTWLFLDRSRNRSRRWCSMESCGNRAKARRHYRRTRKQDR